MKYSPDEHDGRPAAPESETPEPIARWSGGICKTCGNYTHSCKCNHPKSPILDELFPTKTAPTPCPTCGGLREQHLERQLSLAQTEIKGHMRIKDDLEARIKELEDADFLEAAHTWQTKAEQAQSRIAELEKERALALAAVSDGDGLVPEHWWLRKHAEIIKIAHGVALKQRA